MKQISYVTSTERIVIRYGYLFVSGKYQKQTEFGKWKTVLRVPIITDFQFCADKVVRRLYNLKFKIGKVTIDRIVLQNGLPQKSLK